MKHNFILLLLGLFVISILPLGAHPAIDAVRLVDRSTMEAIAGAHFRIGDQIGASDSDGVIRFSRAPSDTLFISHISYGEWILTRTTLSEAITTGIIFREKEIKSTTPITVIALRPVQTGTEQFALRGQDKLAHDGGALLTNAIPAINAIRKSGNYGFDPVLRGFKHEQLNIVIDGVQSAVAACPNRMDPPSSQIAPNMMDHIEVLKGPHSFRYGTAFGGTIIFKSVPVRFAENQNTYLRWTSSAESNGDILRTEALAGIRDISYDLGLFGSYSAGADYQDGDGGAIPAAFQRASVGSQFGYRISENQDINLSATFNQAKDTEFPALPMDLRSDKTWLIRIGHRMDIEASNFRSWQTSVYGSYVDHRMDNFDKVLNPRRMNAETEARTKSTGLRSELIWQYQRHKLYSGIDFRYESADGTRSREFLMGPNTGKVVADNVWNGGAINRTAVFAEYHYSFNTMRFILSGRLESNLSQATDPDTKFAERNSVADVHQWNPNISIGGILSISDQANLGIWLGRAQRSGSLTERFINSFPVGLDAYDMLGNPQLKPESNTQLDVTYEFKNQDVSLNATVFAGRLYNHISAVIDTSLTPVMPSSPGVRRYVNLEHAMMTGFEISWQHSVYTNLAHNLSIAYTYGQDISRNEPLPEIAPLELRYELFGYFYANTLRPTVTFRYVHQQNRVSRVFGEQNTPAFTVLDAVVLYQLNQDIQIRCGIQNIFNRSYYEHLSRLIKGQDRPIYAPGRNYFISIALNFM